MSEVFDITGENDFYLRSSSAYMDTRQSDQILSLGHVLFPICNRSQICTPMFVTKQPTIEVLPDECLFEIFRRLSGAEEKNACACVSKRWLMLASNIRANDMCPKKSKSSSTEGISIHAGVIKSFLSQWKELDLSDGTMSRDSETENHVKDGYLSRCLEGKKATDIRLAAIAVGARGRGGLGELTIRGSNYTRPVTDSGLKAIAYGCPSLRYLSLQYVPSIGDEGLVEIANGCPMLETVDFSHCPGISDKALQAIATNCPGLTSLTLDSCSSVGNEGLVSLACNCPNLRCVTIKNCSNVGDQGIGNLFTLAGKVLTKVTLDALNITDVSLAVMGRYGSSLTDLVLSGLKHVNERGFWVMGNCLGLMKLQSFSVSACEGMTDIGLVAVVKGSPYLKRACFKKCVFVSDNGIVSFVKDGKSIQSLRLDECERITHMGIFGILTNCGSTFKTIALANCFGIKDVMFGATLTTPCHSLQSLSVRNCPGFGNGNLSAIAGVCPNIAHIELKALDNISDIGILHVVMSSVAGLVKVKLNGCVNVTDSVVLAIAKQHGGMVEVLEMDGCKYLTDASLWAIAENCSVLTDLDVSQSRITDAGITALANNVALQVSMRVLSLAGCSSLSDNSFLDLVTLGDSLVGLNIKDCNGINSDVVDLLEEQLWTCHILS